MLKILILFCLFALAAACGEKEHVNRIHIPGTRENACASASSEEMARRGISYQDQVVSKTDFWIYKTQFSFDKELNSVMPVMYLYEAQIEKGMPSTVVPGIDIGFRQLITEFKMTHPDVIQAEAQANAYLSVAISCNPDVPFGAYDSRQEIGEASDTVVANKRSETVEYYNKTSIDFVDAGGRGNPDGSNTVVRCSRVMMKDCRSSFVLAPGVLVTYKYPLEQKEDWRRIRDFIVGQFNQAIKER